MSQLFGLADCNNFYTSCEQMFQPQLRGKPFRKELSQYSNSVTISLDGSTSDTGEIVKAALYGLGKIYRSNIPNKKAGVLLLDLQTAGTAPRRETLMQTMDRLNQKFGAGAISYEKIPQSRTWYMNQKSRSQRFTTHWKELLVAKIISDHAQTTNVFYVFIFYFYIV